MKEAFDWSDRWLDVFREICARRWGFHYGERDAPALRQLVERAFQASGLPDIEALAGLLTSLPDSAPEIQAFIGQMVVGETSFFRNRPQFAALARRILPDLVVARRASGERSLRIWSAGCATGEEPYSLALLLCELVPDWQEWDISILGTDINPFALRRARQALYSNWSFRDVDSPVIDLYFERVGGLRKLTHPCRSIVRFFRHNLVVDPFPDRARGLHDFDLILCRNVTIYFDRSVTARIADDLFASLRPGGWLLVGHTEPDAELYARYELVDFPDTVVYRRPEPEGAEAEPAGPHTGDLGEGPAPRLCGSGRPAALGDDSPSLREALDAYEARELSRAYELLVVLCQQDHVDPIAPHLLAQISADEKRYDEALYWGFTALQREPFHVPTLLVLGLVYLEVRETDRAKSHFQQAIFLDPKCPEAHLYLSLAQRALGNEALADRSRERAARLVRDAADEASTLLPVQRARLLVRAS